MSTYLAFLKWLAKNTKRAPRAAEAVAEDGMYHVQVGDLNNIIRALDTFTCRGSPSFMKSGFTEDSTL